MLGFTPKFATLAILMIFFTQIAVAQTPAKENVSFTPQRTPNEGKYSSSAWTVEALLNERDNLNKQITDLNNQIAWLTDALAKRDEIVRLKAKGKTADELDDQMRVLLGYAGVSEAQVKELDTLIIQRKSSLREMQNQKTAIDAELVHRLQQEVVQHGFKFKTSLTFAALVGVVIIGFFVIALRDKHVGREIFGGQAGIQFVTLFSLVIAIILFGIIDILEGKELAALLGGLSGYILGRATPTGRKEETGATTQPQPDADRIIPKKTA